MPLPLLFIGIAVAAGTAGAAANTKAGVDMHRAKKLNANSEERIKAAGEKLDALRKQCGTALESLGAEKLFVLEHGMQSFVDTFSQLKNVDFSDSVGLEELKHLHIDELSFEELKELKGFVSSFITGTAAGAAGGALVALGAYGLATTFATASTGTAIATLSGAAATNATLAFFGGGSLAVGGLGMAGGAAVLGGLVAGPALLVMGIITGSMAGKSLQDAIANAAEADVTCEQLENGCVQCTAIRRRTYLFYTLLARMDAYFTPLVFKMQDIVKAEGTDYSLYAPESKKIVASAASAALSIKAILDTPILSEDGGLTEESEALGDKLMREMKTE